MNNNEIKVKFSIRNKLILVYTLLLSVSIVTVGSIYFLESRAAFEKRILSDLSAIAKSRADQIATLVEKDFEIAALVASRTRLRECLGVIETQRPENKKCEIDLTKTLNDVKKATKSIKQIDVIDTKGVIICSTAPEGTGKDLSLDVLFKKGIEKPYLGDFFADNENYHYDIAVPIYGLNDMQNNIIGVAKVSIDVLSLFNVLKDYSGLGQTGELILGKLLDGEILFLNPSRHKEDSFMKLRIPMGINLAVPMKLALSKERGIVTGLDYRGEMVLSAYNYISIGDWGLVVKIDIKEAFSFIGVLLMQTGLVSLLVLVLSCIVVIYFSGFITRPIHLLHLATEKIAAGELDYKIQIKTRDEIEQLATAFNKMAEDLKASYQTVTVRSESLVQANKELYRRGDQLDKSNEELRELKKGLEMLISDRTRELEKAKKDLEQKVIDLEKFNRIAVGRELKMRELKDRIDELEERLKTYG